MYLDEVLINPIELKGWVNGSFYLPTAETVGILPVPADIRAASGMTEFNANLDNTQQHSYLAKMQGTHKAILPVHTPEEHTLFRNLMKVNSDFISHNWKAAAVLWNEHADREQKVFYKVSLFNCT